MTRVGIIGLGYWGPNIVRSMEQSGAKVAWLCDLRPDRLEPLRPLYPSARLTADYRDVMNDPGIDAVAISTPVFDVSSEKKFLGVVAMTVEVGRFVELRGGDSPFAVLIDNRDDRRTWSTVGASSNIIEASLHAVVDGIEYGLLSAAGDRTSPG